MSEISKLYENAGIKCLHPSGFCKYIGATCEVCERHKYPPFTAEKQLRLIKEIDPGYPLYYAGGDYDNFSFEEGLAYRINDFWEDLMEIQKQQIKEILE